MPGFAVGVVFVAFAASFRVEGERGQAEDVREREDVPGIFGNDVGDEEIDFGECVGDGASVDAAVGVDAVEAVEQLGGTFHLDAPEGGRGGVERTPRGAVVDFRLHEVLRLRQPVRFALRLASLRMTFCGVTF